MGIEEGSFGPQYGGAGTTGFNWGMLQQMLAGMGGALGGKGSWQESAGNALMKYKASKNQLSVLQKLLGDMPEGSKISADAKNTTVKLPTGMLSDTGESKTLSTMLAGGGGAAPAPVGVQSQPSAAPVSVPSNLEGTKYSNPSSSPLMNISASDVVGLSPENIMGALQLRHGQQQLAMAGQQHGEQQALAREKFEQQKITDIMDMAHKAAQIGKLERGEAIDQPFPIQLYMPGGNPITVTNRQWAELPQKTREYQLYAHGAKLLGETPMSAKDYEVSNPTERERFLRAAMADPKLMSAATELAKAGAINLGEKVETKKELAKVEFQTYFSNPKEFSSDLNKHMNNEKVKTDIDYAATMSVPAKDASGKKRDSKTVQSEIEAAKKKGRTTEVVKFIENRITGGGGEIQSVRWASDKKDIMIWTVKTPSSDVVEIKYNVRQ